jgi:drug/metabolite transporter (DMT)-like permease
MNTPLRDLGKWSAGEVGFYYAFTAFAFMAVLDIANRWALTTHNLHMSGLMMVQLLAGGGVMVLLAHKPAGASLKTFLKKPLTWAVGLYRSFELILYFLALHHVTATEFGFLMKANVLLIFVLTWLVFKRTPGKNEWFGLGLLALSIAGLLAFDFPGWLALGLVLAVSLPIESILIELHPDLNHPHKLRQQLWYSGHLLFASGVVLTVGGVILGLIASHTPFYSLIQPFAATPQVMFTPEVLWYGVISGIIIRSPYLFYTFQAVRKAKSEIYQLTGALSPFLTLGLESALGALGLVNVKSLSISDIAWGLLIVIGSVWVIVARIQKEHQKMEDEAVAAHPLFGNNPFYSHSESKEK